MGSNKPADANELDTDYSEKPDGIYMSEQMRKVVSLV